MSAPYLLNIRSSISTGLRQSSRSVGSTLSGPAGFTLCKQCARSFSQCGQKKSNAIKGHFKTAEHKWIKPVGYESRIRIYNSLTNRKEPLILPNGQVASWYACGPTVYDHAHIGHASSYVRQDVIRRIIQQLHNIDVVMVMGITDIDDKIIKRANEQNVDYRELTKQYEKSFLDDMRLLNVLPATLKTRVTEHIPQIIRFIEKICDNGYAYRTNSGDVYFDLQAFGRYNRLVAHNMETAESEGGTEKKHQSDFALWKAAKPGEPFWESPWGNGRPGWHIECSTMSSHVFGKTLDIHSGGEDLKFPHHENELAQSEAHFCCNQWTNYWLHTGHLHLRDDVKMSKSLNNTILISDLLKTYTADHFRLFCMMRPYTSTIEYSKDAMEPAVRIVSKWNSFISGADDYIKSNLDCGPINEAYIMHSLQQTKENVMKALSDDFDTRRAVNAIEELVKRCNKEIAPKPNKPIDTPRSPAAIAAVAKYLENMFEVFGFSRIKQKGNISDAGETLNQVVDATLQFRENVRKFAIGKGLSKAEKKEVIQRNKALIEHCDEIRKDLSLCGIKVKDQNEGSTWEFAAEHGTSQVQND